MASSSKTCDICYEHHQMSPAVVWCAECEESLCDSCKKHHAVAKLTKRHDTIAMETFEQLPKFVKEMKNECQEHGLRFEYFCSKHDHLCCVECIRTEHIECLNLSPIHQVIARERSLASLDNLESVSTEFLHHIKQAMDDRMQNIRSLAEQKNSVFQQINDTRGKLVSKLDRLFNKLKNDLDFEHSEKAEMINDTLKTLKEKERAVMKCIDQSQVIRTCATDFQVYRSVQSFQVVIGDMERQFQKIITSDSMKTFDITFEPQDEKCFQNLFGSVGQIIVREKDTLVKPYYSQAKQIQFHYPQTDAEQVDLSKLKCEVFEIDKVIDSENIMDHVFLGKGNFLLSDKNNNRLLFCKDKSLHRTISTNFEPMYLAQIDTNQIAVTSFNSRSLYSVDLDTENTSVLFEADGNITSLSTHRQGFCFRVDNTAFNITNLIGEKMYAVPFIGNHIRFAKFLHNRIYFTQWKTDKVMCCNLKGELIWEYSAKFKWPLGLDTVNDVLYITGFYSGCIVALKNDGKEVKEIYSNSKTARMRSITCKGENLFVTTESGIAVLFKVSSK